MKRRRVLGLFLFLYCFAVIAQVSNGKIKVYMEGEIMDYDYIRRTIDFVDYVNDPKDSDVYILITEIATAGKGTRYEMSFEGITFANIKGYKLICNIAGTDTEDMARIKFNEILKSGLLPFVNNNQLSYSISTERANKLNESLSSSVINDPWRNWVFSVELQGGLDAEEQKKKYTYQTTISAFRTTEKIRIWNKYDFAREENIIEKNEEGITDKIHTVNQNQALKSGMVYSITDHWSAGLIIRIIQDTYKNLKNYVLLWPAVEYNFFNWDEANEKVFTIAYHIGPEIQNYYEKSILDKSGDRLISESIKTDFKIIEKWGNIEFWIEASHYFPDFKYYLIESGSDLSLRVAKGLFVEFSLSANKIKNQIYLPATELTDEEILLNVRKLPTSFEFSTEIGIKFMFGSIYNSIVNVRL